MGGYNEYILMSIKYIGYKDILYEVVIKIGVTLVTK